MGKRVGVATWQEKYKRWQYKAQKDGVRRTFYSCTPGRKGQRECHAKVDEWLDEGIEDGGKRVSNMFDQWIEELKITTSRSYWDQYECYGRNYIKPVIGHIKMSALNEGHLQAVINKAHAKGLAKKTLMNISACMKAFVKHERKWKTTTLYPEDITIPRSAPVGKRVILQPNDLKILFAVDETTLYSRRMYDIYVNAYRFAVLTGLRPGELVGLKWSDIKGDVIHLRRSINKYHEETTGKNDNARRTLQMSALAKGIIDKQRSFLLDSGILSEFVFPDKNGEHAKQHTFYGRWVKYRESNNIKNKASPYELRHTFVSVAKALPEGMLKRVVGHSKDMDTYGVYSHEVDGDMSVIAEQLQTAFMRYL